MRGIEGRTVARALVAALLAVGLAGCAAPATDGPSANTVRALLSADPLSLSIIGKGDRYSAEIGRLLSDALVQYDADQVLRPRLAESWEVSEDGRTVTFRLRPGVRWHDGKPVTARDVKFTIDKVRDPATEARGYVSVFDDFGSIGVVDALTLRATYRVAYADYLEGWWVPIIPEHLASRDEDLLTGEFAERPVGCGPFRFVEHVPGQRLVLEANPDYWDDPPRIDRLVFRIFPDERTGFQALLKGEVDLMPAAPDIWREAQDSERADEIARSVFYRNNVWYLGWNQDGTNDFFTDARVRRAMTSSLDRQSFSDSVTQGLALPGVTTWHPRSPWNDGSIEPWPYDPEAARRLLAEAGWTDDDGDGVRERDGVPFSFTLLVRASTQEIVDRLVAWVQQSLADVGVRMEIEKLEPRAFQERVRAFEFEAMMSGFVFTPIPDQYEIYHSSGRELGFNYVGLADDEVDRLCEEGRRTFDPGERLRIYHRLQRRLHELEPFTCLFNFASTLLHDARLRGLEPSPLGYWRITPGPRAWHWAESPPEG